MRLYTRGRGTFALFKFHAGMKFTKKKMPLKKKKDNVNVSIIAKSKRGSVRESRTPSPPSSSVSTSAARRKRRREVSINYYVRTGPLLKTLQFHPATSKQTGVCCKECEGSERCGGGWKVASSPRPLFSLISRSLRRSAVNAAEDDALAGY